MTGMALDVAFHTLQDGSVTQVLLNGSDNPDPLISTLALTAQCTFLLVLCDANLPAKDTVC